MWRKSNKQSFDQRFPAGNEAGGRTLFVTQTIHSIANTGFLSKFGTDVRKVFDKLESVYVSITIDDSGNVSSKPGGQVIPEDEGWHLGKAGTHLRDGNAYSYDGKEYNSIEHYVFAPDDPENYEWVPAQNGEYPSGAVVGWNSKERQIVARIAWEGGVHPGKLVVASKTCYIGYGGAERGLQGYEVLRRKV